MKKVKKSLLICLAVVVAAFIVISIGNSFSQVLDNDVRVAENSDLTYYLDVIYDGKDSDVVTSSDTATANVNSDYIYVEDKIPEGLIFKEFVSTEDKTIGAVKRSDGSSCPGYVVGGVDGLKYDEATRLVSFRVKNLQAGCKLTVGIVTTTPSLNGKKRMDFYNTATARENDFSINSNTVHVFMGKEDSTLYSVSYKYTGSIPDGAENSLPVTNKYPAGTEVGVANNPTVPGYTFSGWTTSGATVADGKFSMPEADVEFVGSFVKKPVYKVSYTVSGEMPNGYMAPREKEYGEKDDVLVDSLKVGDIVNGYRFLGWTNDDLTIEDGVFQMPKNDVELVGSFEKVSYKVTYKFQGTNIPPEGDALLPAEASHYPGDEVTVADDPVATGYKFLGWYSSKTFEMPEENVVIYGEWMLEAGTFTPTIEKTITNKKDYYKKGDKVAFEITVNNTAAYPIKEVLLQEMLDGAYFVEGTGYELLNEQYVKILTIPANGSIVVNAEYTAKDDVLKEISNKVALKGALADNNNHLDTSKKYEATAKFKVSNIRLNINKLNAKHRPLEGAEFTLYSDMSLTTEVGKGLEFTGLQPEHVYYLKETKAPKGYQLLGDALKVSVNSRGEIAIDNYEVTNDSGVGTVKIVNEKINVLPNTGGIGIIIYVLLGVGIIGGASIWFILHLKKKDEVNKK